MSSPPSGMIWSSGLRCDALKSQAEQRVGRQLTYITQETWLKIGKHKLTLEVRLHDIHKHFRLLESLCNTIRGTHAGETIPASRT